MTIALPPELSQALADYAELYRKGYGEAESVQELVPAMLRSFLESGGCSRGRRGRAS